MSDPSDRRRKRAERNTAVSSSIATKQPLPAKLRLLNADLARVTAEAAIRWAVDAYGNDLCLLSSMQDAVLIDLALGIDPTIDIVFLDNGYHFAETLEMANRVERIYGISVRRVSVAPAASPTSIAPGACCDLKPQLLDEALEGKQAWLSGLRRSETPERSRAEAVESDRRGLTKINPLVGWTQSDVDAYIDARAVPVNPLRYQGYPSIGCQPCTIPAASGRDGRWADSDRTECGLHL